MFETQNIDFELTQLAFERAKESYIKKSLPTSRDEKLPNTDNL